MNVKCGADAKHNCTAATSRGSTLLDAVADIVGSIDRLPPDLSARKKKYLRSTGYGRKRTCSERPAPPALPSDASDMLRRQLVSELAEPENSEALAGGRSGRCPFSKADAEVIEAAFTARLLQFGDLEPSAPKHQEANSPYNQSQVDSSKQTVTVISKPLRERDREHLQFVASQPCLICGRSPSDAHHVKFAEAARDRGGRSAIGSPFPFAGCTTVNSTGGATSAPGGMARGSIRW